MEKLRSRYLHTLALFRIYERFRKLSAPNIVGKKKAEANVKIMSQHVYFFIPVQEAARCYFFVELAKFFDENKKKQSLTIEHILGFIENNFASFSKEEFQKYHAERNFIPELLEGYKPFMLQDVKKFRKRLARNKVIIKNLKTYRDKVLVHSDIKAVQVQITGKDIKVLLNIVQDAIDLLYLKLDFASNMYSNYDKEPPRAVDEVIKILQEYEKERLKKIKEKYGF